DAGRRLLHRLRDRHAGGASEPPAIYWSPDHHRRQGDLIGAGTVPAVEASAAAGVRSQGVLCRRADLPGLDTHRPRAHGFRLCRRALRPFSRRARHYAAWLQTPILRVLTGCGHRTDSDWSCGKCRFERELLSPDRPSEPRRSEPRAAFAHGAADGRLAGAGRYRDGGLSDAGALRNRGRHPMAAGAGEWALAPAAIKIAYLQRRDR